MRAVVAPIMTVQPVGPGELLDGLEGSGDGQLATP